MTDSWQRVHEALSIATKPASYEAGTTWNADVVVAVSRLARDHGDRISALDLNPVVATPDGAVAVDVLIIPSPEETA